MKAAFWMAPEGAGSPVTLLPITPGDAARRDAPPLLSTTEGEAAIARCPRVAALLPLLTAALATQAAGQPGQLFDLAGLEEVELKLVADITGAGEVAATVALPGGVIAQIEESVMAGLWRVRFADAEGRLVADYLEVAAIPQAVRRAAAMTRPAIAPVTPPQEATTAPALITEIAGQMAAWRPGAPNHVVTLSLLPVSTADMAVLHEALGDGPVAIVSRGHGSCRVLATATRLVWSVQYLNASGELILDTLEVGDVPAVACAAAEDFADAAERLRQIERAYFT